jgi:hypothetical protein
MEIANSSKPADAPVTVALLMREFKPHWFIAGGWAIDLFLGKQTREHVDIEIAIFRRDQIALQNFLRDWNLQIAANGELSEWKRGEYLELPAHAIHCFNDKAEPRFLEVLLNEKDGGIWQYRRNRQITKPLSELYLTTESGIRLLSPEVVLLYKSKNVRPKDELDFHTAFGHLTAKSRKWLKEALLICHPQHDWLEYF